MGEVVLEERPDYIRGLSGRRLKAALVLAGLWSGVMTLHWLSWGAWLVYGLAGVLGVQALRLVLVSPRLGLPGGKPRELEAESLDAGGLAVESADCPRVALLVAAKNESAVIGRLVENLSRVDYPSDRLEIWVIDDHSEDETPELLRTLKQRYSNLKVFRRPAQASGGKSGALNQVWPLTQAEFIGIFDADAQVPLDVLRAVLPLFAAPEVGAVQTRKVIANPEVNALTWGQHLEMILDSYFQQQRIAVGGIGELRGNGEFVRRQALEACGGFNEATITDDLDLTLRLHFDGWRVEFLLHPGVLEEGVTTLSALWHQRNRWAEGGYQRYLDYWRLILANRTGTLKGVDLLGFIVIQYLLPMAMVPDLVMAIALGELPVLTPLSLFSLGLPTWALLRGLDRVEQASQAPRSSLLQRLGQTGFGLLYMMHWLVIMPVVTTRMAMRPKQLKWVKTVHTGEVTS